MASINSLMGGNSRTSSIFGNRNVISGLASGMDTEGMIENAVSGYKMKISKLQQQRTKMEWQQTAYRSMIEKMVHFNQKYTSFASGNNLMSRSFFDSAIKAVANGANANKVSVSGHTSSKVTVNSIEKLATSAKYSASPAANNNLQKSNEAVGGFSLKDASGNLSGTDVGKLDGYLSIGYGGKSVQIRFSDKDVFKSADEMADAINKKLAEQTISFDKGGQEKASERIKAVAKSDGTIAFENVKNDGNSIWISGANENVKTALGIDPSSDKKDLTSFKFDQAKVVGKETNLEVIGKKGFTITLNDKTRTINGPTEEELKAAAGGGTWNDETYIKVLQEKIDKEFGKDALTVKDLNSGDPNKIQLSFAAKNGSDRFEVTSGADNLMGMEGGLSSHMSTKRKLGDLLTGDAWKNLKPVTVDDKDVTPDADGKTGVDKDGNKVKKAADGSWNRVDKDGNELYALEMNGKTVGTFSKESKLEDVMNAINNSEDSDFKVSYSTFTKEFVFEAKESGADKKLELDGLGKALFGTDGNDGMKLVEAGQKAKFTVTVNGGAAQTIEQDSNSIEIDGMTITLKETFDASSEPITFGKTTDADKVVEAVKTMVEDYNAMAEEIKKAYSTMPMLDNKGNNYEPLTDEDRAEMSESAIKAYEEKAKTGLLFADRELSNLYSDMTSALSVLGVSGNDGLKLGLTTSYKDGSTTLEFDEKQFRKALEDDPEKVKKVFTSSVENGDSSNGLMKGIQNQLEKYAGTTGALKGILVEKAGSPLAPSSILKNTMQEKLDSFDKQVETLRTKMRKQVDYYNRKFTALEQLIAQMNSQSSSLMGMTGGF